MILLTKRLEISIWSSFQDLVLLFCLLFFGFSPVAAQTSPTPEQRIVEVEVPEESTLVTFYSHSFGENFPHAFVIIESPEEDAQPEAFGFSARSLSPGLLLGSVRGEMKVPGKRYIRQSKPQFSMALNTEQLSALRAVRSSWEAPKKPKYHLEKRNCVHFVGELAQAAGLQVNAESEHFKSPGKFLREIVSLNSGLVEPLSEE